MIFIFLLLPKEIVVKRLVKRHGTREFADTITDMCVKLNEAYKNVYDVVIDGKMTLDDVAKKILDIVNKD